MVCLMKRSRPRKKFYKNERHFRQRVLTLATAENPRDVIDNMPSLTFKKDEGDNWDFGHLIRFEDGYVGEVACKRIKTDGRHHYYYGMKSYKLRKIFFFYLKPKSTTPVVRGSKELEPYTVYEMAASGKWDIGNVKRELPEVIKLKKINTHARTPFTTLLFTLRDLGYFGEYIRRKWRWWRDKRWWRVFATHTFTGLHDEIYRGKRVMEVIDNLSSYQFEMLECDKEISHWEPSDVRVLLSPRITDTKISMTFEASFLIRACCGEGALEEVRDMIFLLHGVGEDNGEITGVPSIYYHQDPELLADEWDVSGWWIYDLL